MKIGSKKLALHELIRQVDFCLKWKSSSVSILYATFEAKVETAIKFEVVFFREQLWTTASHQNKVL